MSVSKKSWTGVAVESPAGTAATTPTVYVPCNTKVTNKTKYVYLNENRGGRDANTKRLGTVRMAQTDVTGSFYNDTWAYFLLGFMGHDTPSQPAVSTDPTVWSHALTLVDIPPSLTIFKGYDVQGFYMAYGVVEKMTLEWAADGKLLDSSVTMQSQYRQKISGGSFSGMTPTYSAINLFAGYAPTLQINGTGATNIESMKVELSQKITLFYAINGNRSYVKPYFGDRSGKISFTASFDDSSMTDNFDNETDLHINVVFAGDTISHTYKESLTLDFPIVGLDTADVETSKDYIEVNATGTARPGTAINSMMTATVQNTVASYAL